MKKYQCNTIVFGLITLLTVLACQKEVRTNSSNSNSTPPGGQPPNITAPKANAGPDQIISLPVDSVLLDGSASKDANGNIEKFIWKKASGPASFNIIKPSESKTIVRNLVAGTYQFELQVTNAGGLIDRDTMQVTVYQETTSALVDVYVAGEENDLPVYWKNGQAIVLNNNSWNYSGASIAVNGSDIAVAQSRYGLIWNEDAANYWKNGHETKLGIYSGATSIALRGNDVYVAGWEWEVIKPFAVAKYWENGQEVTLTDRTKDASANSIFVVGNDIYVAGEEGDVAKYWKNGQAISLTNGVHQAYANSIVVVGSDVYVAGAEGGVAKYWKNGQEVSLSNGTKYAVATSIAVVGNDVYVVGYEGTYYDLAPKYWKNGHEVTLTNGINPEIAWSISVHNNDVYIAISEYNFNNGNRVAKYWKNGKFVILSDKGTARSIVVVDR